MADKKITIKPSDMERLRELMRQEEEKLDAANPSDAELTAMESQLEDSIRRLAKKTPGALPSVDAEMDRNWAALQQKLKAVPAAKEADVLPLTRKPKNKAIPWIGLVAAAALVMVMLRPRPDDVAMNEGNVQIKGNAASTMKSDCTVDVGSLDGSAVTQAKNGLGFEGPAGSRVEISVKCASDGFMRAEIKGAETKVLTTAVTREQRQRILQDGKIAEIPLQSQRPWVISLILADQDFKDQPVPEDHILWQDQISVGARE